MNNVAALPSITNELVTMVYIIQDLVPIKCYVRSDAELPGDNEDYVSRIDPVVRNVIAALGYGNQGIPPYYAGFALLDNVDNPTRVLIGIWVDETHMSMTLATPEGLTWKKIGDPFDLVELAVATHETQAWICAIDKADVISYLNDVLGMLDIEV